MDLTQEQLDQIISGVVQKVKNSFKNEIESIKQSIPDIADTVTKKHLTDCIESLKEGFNKEIVALQESVKKIAEETDTKIRELTPPKNKPWWGTVLDYED